jgi:hypothetical protein
MKVAQLVLLLLFASSLYGQPANQPADAYYRFAVSNSQTAKPFGKLSSLFYKDFHPGLEIGYGKLKAKLNHQWFGELNLSYLFHRWVQHNLALSANGGYRHMVGSSWGAKAKLGGGFQLSIPVQKVFAISENGLKEKGHILRPQFVASLALGFDKKISDRGQIIFLEYVQKIQTPFIKEYVPLLPYNSLMIGIALPVQ